jgi:hypothetical protein|tara:strand:- start:768 stop:1229 length:462 start_codon:yes stop_codon:yes gene_type:complete
MTGEEKLNEFLQAVEDWASCRHIAKVKEKKDVVNILNLTSSDLQTLTASECLCHAYELYAYAEYIETIRTKENTILEWADSSIWYIISTALQQYGDKYTKWQEKYYSAVKENPLASEILKIKGHAEARVNVLRDKANRIHRMAEILNSLSKRR